MRVSSAAALGPRQRRTALEASYEEGVAATRSSVISKNF